MELHNSNNNNNNNSNNNNNNNNIINFHTIKKYSRAGVVVLKLKILSKSLKQSKPLSLQ